MINIIKKTLIRFNLLSNQNIYVIIDWGASGLAFLTTWFVYQSSEDLTQLGYGGWLLNVLMTSLFISAAAQYYAMFRNETVINTFIRFLPVLVIESIVLGFILDFKGQLIVTAALFANVLFAAFRGNLLGNHKMAQGALCNAAEQGLRFIALVILVKSQVSFGTAILLNNLIAYFITASVVVVILIRKKETKISWRIDKQVFFYAGILVIINVLSSGDVLSLKNAAYVGEFVLVKPWGQIFLVLLLPLINILLVKHKHKENYIGVLLFIVTMFVGYSSVALLLGGWISRLVFGFEVSSTLLILAVIVEHLAIGFILVVLYKMLYSGKIVLHNVVPVIIGLLLMLILPSTGLDLNYFIVFPIIFSIVALINYKFLLS